MKEFVIRTENELIEPVKWLVSQLDNQYIVCLEGQLGAGKTAFVKKVLDYHKSIDEATSPTYSIINEYKIGVGKLYHMDLYRLNSLEEALDIGIEEYLYSKCLCFIEWSAIIKPILPDDCINVKIDVLEDSSRKLLISNL